MSRLILDWSRNKNGNTAGREVRMPSPTTVRADERRPQHTRRMTSGWRGDDEMECGAERAIQLSRSFGADVVVWLVHIILNALAP